MIEQINILIVDDSPDNLRVVSGFLKEKGYQLALALNGKDAIKILETNRIYLILLDIMMPDMDGFETCRLIKKNEQMKNIPLIFLSAKIETDDIVKGFDVGGIDYISKPFRKEELFARVKTHLGLSISRRIIERQASELCEINQRILSSIYCAENIQREMLPSKNVLTKRLPDSFLIYNPRDILSGDFYWFTEFQDKFCIIIADCTGHGIPGAFISIMAITLLNQLPEELRTTEPSKILDYMRVSAKKILHQITLESNNTDGFDMGIVIIDQPSKLAYFSGANIDLHIVSDNNGQVNTIESDPMPVSVYRNERAFTKHTIQIEENDKYYMFSDGLTDLFNENQTEKYSKKRILNYLLQIRTQAFSQQEQLIINEINTWKGESKQVDDIVIAGIRVS